MVGRVMAHYHDPDFDKFYRRTTIGQLMLLDDNALEYVKLTSPFGSGEEGDKSSGMHPTRNVAPTREAAKQLSQRLVTEDGKKQFGMRDLGTLTNEKRDQLSPIERAALYDLEKGRDARN